MLFTCANLLACLCANLLQGRFNKATQDKLTEALRKARRPDHSLPHVCVPTRLLSLCNARRAMQLLCYTDIATRCLLFICSA